MRSGASRCCWSSSRTGQRARCSTARSSYRCRRRDLSEIVSITDSNTDTIELTAATSVEAVVLSSNLDGGVAAVDDPVLGTGSIAVVAGEKDNTQTQSFWNLRRGRTYQRRFRRRSWHQRRRDTWKCHRWGESDGSHCQRSHCWRQ